MAIDIGKPDPIDCGEVGINCVENPTNLNIANIFFKFINPLLALAGTIFIVALVYGGITYVMSTGDEAKAQKAKLIIIYATIGFLVTLIAGIVVNVVISVF